MWRTAVNNVPRRLVLRKEAMQTVASLIGRLDTHEIRVVLDLSRDLLDRVVDWDDDAEGAGDGGS